MDYRPRTAKQLGKVRSRSTLVARWPDESFPLCQSIQEREPGYNRNLYQCGGCLTLGFGGWALAYLPFSRARRLLQSNGPYPQVFLPAAGGRVGSWLAGLLRRTSRTVLIKFCGSVFLAPAISMIARGFALAIHGPVVVEAESMATTAWLHFA